jgi:branched-chain amino acid transport system ATP-binding protein
MSETLLQLQNATVQYGGVTALDKASIALGHDEVVALMGPNGAGKSTVIKAIFGIAPLAGGEVIWNGQTISPVPHQMPYRGLAYVPQGRQVFQSMSVHENLEVGGWVLKSRSLINERIGEILEMFPNLKEKINERAGVLSGGQQQMLVIARGLMTYPHALLLDEPSLGLAPKLVKEVFAKIREINESRDTAILVVEHNIHSLLEFVDQGYVLDKGRIALEDQPDKILNSDTLEKVFLGEYTKQE